MLQITVEELKQRLNGGGVPLLLDVRETWEYEICHIGNSVHISMSQIPARIGELNSNDEIVVLCHHGVRSMQVAGFLEAHGFNVSNLTGGIDAWARTVEPSMPKY